jgi:hypothetical protein
LPFRLVEQADHLDGHFVVNAITMSVLRNVVDPRHVLVADALDAVRAEAVRSSVGHCSASLARHLALGEQLLQVVARADGARRAGGEHGASQRSPGRSSFSAPLRWRRR